MKYAVLYEMAADATPKIREHMSAHRAWWEAFRERGSLLAIGPFSDASGALGVFTTREAAEEYVAADPFVTSGAVQKWTIREWNEVLL
jgi:uncharacterized protein YciI